MSHLKIESTADGIQVATIDCPDASVNAVSSRLLEEIATALDQLAADKQVRGLVILSGKPDNFIVGADVDELKGMGDQQQVEQYIRKGHGILDRLATLPMPVVCGIHGTCLGGGLELALVADYRVATDTPETLFGLPEVQLGLFPAAGGTHRLPRLVGFRNALPMLLAGKRIRTRKARQIGLVDETVHPYALKAAAIQNASRLSRATRSTRHKKKPWMDRLLDGTSLGRRLVLKQAEKSVQRKTHGLYPAPICILESVRSGYNKGIGAALEEDARKFAELVISSEARALMTLFFSMTALKKNPYGKAGRPVHKTAVLGAGLMGSGIAGAAVTCCETVLIKDVSLEAAASGMEAVQTGLARKARSGAITRFETKALYGRLVACDDFTRFRNTDLVIEAIFEDLDLKRRTLQQVEDATGDDTIFASNTSSLPISSIAEGCRRPENVIGMHYFSPVHRMPLLEIITTEKTADWVTATAVDFGIRQGKTCIVVKDGPGFYTTRILAPMLNEAVLLLEEGAKIPDIDSAMLGFGYPVGPMALLDEVGIDVGAHVTQSLKTLFEARGAGGSDTIVMLFENGYLGKKNRKGFYRYDVPKRGILRKANSDIYRLVGGINRKPFGVETIQNRLSLMMINEAVRCFEEEIISSPRDGDVGAILGLGFPPFRGGPFQYLDHVGIERVIAQLEDLRNLYGDRFQPAGLLLEMASRGKRFYPGRGW